MHWNSSCSNIEAMSSDQSWGSPLIFPPIRVRVDPNVGTALVPISRQFRRIRVGVNVFFPHWSDLIFPPIRVRVNHYVGTALVPMSRQFSLIRVGVHVFSFHRSELGLTTILEQLLHVFPPIRVRVDHCVETVFVPMRRQFRPIRVGWCRIEPTTLIIEPPSLLGLTTVLKELLSQHRGYFFPLIRVEVDRYIETVFISMSRQFLLDT